MYEVKLKKKREKALLRRHPWIFASAIHTLRGSPDSGETVRIISNVGEFLGWGAYNSDSKIRIRVWSWDEKETVTRHFFKKKLSRALSFRDNLFGQDNSTAIRLVHAESDGLPGLIVDRYNNTLVVQFLSAGVERWRELLIELLLELTNVSTIYERSDSEIRILEGLPKRAGTVYGDELEELLEIEEAGIHYYVNIKSGHKTGFYLDQKINRTIIRGFTAGKDVLDCFCYTGGFSLNALAGIANSVVAIDTSRDTLSIAQENEIQNGYGENSVKWLEGDVFEQLRNFRDENRSFDLIILDPPKFAHTPAGLQRAARGYKDINLLAFKLLRDKGTLFTFSCSGGVDQRLFSKIVADAALDAGVETRVMYYLYQSPDHPVALNFPEGLYLKGLIVKIEKKNTTH